MPTLLILLSRSLKEASKLPKANLLLLESLLVLLQNTAETQPPAAVNLAICVRPHLLSPSEGHTPPLDLVLQVTGKVCCVYQPATAFQAHLRFAVQRYLAATLLQQILKGELQGRAAPPR